MSRSPFKTFIKFRKVINSYEDDCQIFYPTPWDKEYVAYRTYCQDCINEMALSAFNSNIVIDEEMLQYFADFPMYATRSFFCRDEQNYEFSSDFYDNSFEYMQPEHSDCSDSEHEESDTEIIENDADMRFNLNPVGCGSANFAEFEEHQNHCTRCKRRRFRRQPSLLNLGVFLSNLEPEPKILKRRKVKQFHTRKFECVNRKSNTSITSINTSITSIVKSDINIEEIITVEDCHYDKTPSEDSQTFKMTYSKAIHCKSSQFRLIEKTTSNEVVKLRTTGTDDQMDTKDSEHCQNYSGFSLSNFPRLLTAPSTSQQAADYYATEIDHTPAQTATKYIEHGKTSRKVFSRNLAKSGFITSTSNAETDFNMIQIEQAARRSSKIYKTYSQAVFRNLPKTKFSSPRRNEVLAPDETQNDNLDQTSRGKRKTYSQVLFCNLPNSTINEKSISNEKGNLHTTQIDSAFDQLERKDVETSSMYSQVVHRNLSKSKRSKPRSSYKRVDLSKTGIESTFDQVATGEIKSYKTSYSQIVYQNLPKSNPSRERSTASTTRIDNSYDQTSTTDVRTCRTYSQVVYCTVSKSTLIKQTSSNKEVGLDKSPTGNAFDQTHTDDVTTTKTFSQAVSRGVPKFNFIDKTTFKKGDKKLKKRRRRKKSSKEINLSTVEIIKAADQVPTFNKTVTSEIAKDFDQIPVENINETWAEKIKSRKTITEKAELNQIPTNNTNICEMLSQTVDNSVPDLSGQKTFQNDIDENIQLWSTIVNGTSDKTTKHKIASNIESKPREINTIRFSKDIVEIEINPSVPISPAFSIVSAEIYDISPVHDKTATKDLGSETELNSQKNNKTKSDQDVQNLGINSNTQKDTAEMEISPRIPISPIVQIVNAEIHAISSVPDKTATNELGSETETELSTKYNQDIQEVKKELKPSMPTWSQIVTGEKMHATRLACSKSAKVELASNVKSQPQKTNKSKCNPDIPEIDKEVKPSMPTWSEMAGGAILPTSSVRDKTLKCGMDPNTEHKSKVAKEAKLNMKKSRFVKLDLWGTSPLEKTVKKPALFSYADIIKTRKTCASCHKTAPVQSDSVLTPPKYRSNVDSVMGTKPHFVFLNPQVTDDSNQLKTIPSKNKGKWIINECKHKRSKKSKK